MAACLVCGGGAAVCTFELSRAGQYVRYERNEAPREPALISERAHGGLFCARIITVLSTEPLVGRPACSLRSPPVRLLSIVQKRRDTRKRDNDRHDYYHRLHLSPKYYV